MALVDKRSLLRAPESGNRRTKILRDSENDAIQHRGDLLFVEDALGTIHMFHQVRLTDGDSWSCVLKKEQSFDTVVDVGPFPLEEEAWKATVAALINKGYWAE